MPEAEMLAKVGWFNEEEGFASLRNFSRFA